MRARAPAVSEPPFRSCYGFVRPCVRARAVDWARAWRRPRRLVTPTTASASRPSWPGRSRGARAAPRPRLRRRQGRLRRPRRRPRTSTTASSSFDHRGHGESDAPDDPARLLPRPARAPTRWRSPTRSSCATCGCSGTRWAAWSTRRVVLARAAEPVAALVFMDTSAGPPPGIDPELVAARRRGRAHRGPGGAASSCSDELDLLGSAAYQRVLAERPGLPRVRRPQVGGAVAGDVGDAGCTRSSTQPDQLRRAARRSPCRRSCIVGEQDTAFLAPVARHRGGGARRASSS